jgi:hypothetical protein
MISLKNSRINFKNLFKKRNDMDSIQQTKKIKYYNTDLEKYVEIEVPNNINIMTESERFETQKMLAIGYEKSKIKKQEREKMEKKTEEDKTISDICDYYLDSVIYATYSICDVFDDCLKKDEQDDLLENKVYDIYKAFDDMNDTHDLLENKVDDIGDTNDIDNTDDIDNTNVIDDCLENKVYDIYNTVDEVSSVYSDI